MKNISTNKQSGAVSLFVVIFFMLLVTVVTVSFVRLMIHDQQQASNDDLSKSAYDSAQAGVEDAKRAILKYQQNCSNDPNNCDAYGAALSTGQCNGALDTFLGTGSTGEVPVQQTQSGNDATLQQAYTCVTINLDTGDYQTSGAANQSVIVPLYSSRPFDRIHIEWFSKDDVSPATKNLSLSGVNASGQPLFNQGLWPANRPPLVRAQLMQFAGSFNMSNFDVVSGSQSDASTMFLYPTSQPNIGDRVYTAYDQRKTTPTGDPMPKDSLTTPTAVSCEPNLNTNIFACSAVLEVPQAIGAANNDRTAFLRLTPLYNATHFKVTLWDGPVILNPKPNDPLINAVGFKAVQPEVDSTGRANNVFRRVVSRINLFDTNFPYPDAAIDVTGDFCKDFSVTDTQYIASVNTCTP
jgi:Tfp pilus assembly protein PilX